VVELLIDLVFPIPRQGHRRHAGSMTLPGAECQRPPPWFKWVRRNASTRLKPSWYSSTFDNSHASGRLRGLLPQRPSSFSGLNGRILPGRWLWQPPPPGCGAWEATLERPEIVALSGDLFWAWAGAACSESHQSWKRLQATTSLERSRTSENVVALVRPQQFQPAYSRPGLNT